MRKVLMFLLLIIPMINVCSLGFLLILEPFETDNATVPNPVFHFVYVPVSGLPFS